MELTLAVTQSILCNSKTILSLTPRLTLVLAVTLMVFYCRFPLHVCLAFQLVHTKLINVIQESPVHNTGVQETSTVLNNTFLHAPASKTLLLLNT